MDSGDIVVSSVRAGMKREFAMMMKAQLEMGSLSGGPRRMTRSQSSSSFYRDMRMHARTIKKVYSKRVKKDKKLQVKVKDVKDMNTKDVASDVEGADGSIIESGSNGPLRNELESGEPNSAQPLSEEPIPEEKSVPENDGTDLARPLYEEPIPAERSVAENVGADLVQPISEEPIPAERIVPENGGADMVLPLCEELIPSDMSVPENTGADLVHPVCEESIPEERSISENVGANLIQPSSTDSMSLVEVGVRDGSEILLGNLESVEKLEVESRGTDLEHIAMTLSLVETLSSQAATLCTSIADGRNIGFKRSRESTSTHLKTRSRRFTRSCLKVQDEDMASGDSEVVIETQSSLTANNCPSKLEMNMSKKIKLKRTPKRLKDLLNTGLLEGLRVQYVHGAKVNKRARCELGELFREMEYYVIVMNAMEESGNKRPPEYIFLENGRSLKDVLSACKKNTLNSLDQVILDAIGRVSYTTAFCLHCKGIVPEAGVGRPMLLCDSCAVVKETNADHQYVSYYADRSQVDLSPVSISPSSEHEDMESHLSSSNHHIQLKGKRKITRKDLKMHKFVFSEDILPDGTVLSYFMHGKKRLEGVKKGGGILCACCSEVVSPSQFEAHAGFPSRRKPYMSIYTSNGVSLHQLSLELSKNGRCSSAENDDLCSICEDGGQLLCCENCPRAFHSECVGLSSIPQGTWYCTYCQNMFEQEKFADHDANAIAAGRVPGADPLTEISQRCIRIIGSFAVDIGGCAICSFFRAGGHDFSSPEFTDRTVIICDQCEKEYHVGCLREQEMDDLKALPDEEWFCSQQCSSINSVIQKLVSNGEQKLPDDVLSKLKTKLEEPALHHDAKPEFDIKWRLLSGKNSSEDTRAWLSGAVSIFHERFDPIADASTGRLDLIPHMVYGRQFKDQDFCGMHCALLTVNSAVVSAGLFRIFGEEVAELPLVATRSDSQGKGYFQTLYHCIENLLKSQNVKDLVLPAADEAHSMWKNRFGFERLDQEQLDKYKRSYQMMMFEGTAVLHKNITSQ